MLHRKQEEQESGASGYRKKKRGVCTQRSSCMLEEKRQRLQSKFFCQQDQKLHVFCPLQESFRAAACWLQKANEIWEEKNRSPQQQLVVEGNRELSSTLSINNRWAFVQNMASRLDWEWEMMAFHLYIKAFRKKRCVLDGLNLQVGIGSFLLPLLPPS